MAHDGLFQIKVSILIIEFRGDVKGSARQYKPGNSYSVISYNCILDYSLCLTLVLTELS